MPKEILREFGIDPSLALTPEERQRAKNRDPLADLSPAERFRYRALQSLSLGFFRPQMPEASTFGGKAAEFAGTIAGSIPAVIASTATGGAPLAGLAGRAGAGALGQFIARELGTGLAFEAMNLPSRFWHGDDPRSIASEAAKGVGLGVGISLAGRALGRGLQTLTRRGRGTATSEAIRTPSPGPETPPGPPASQVAGEMAAINKYIDDLRAFYKERPYLISRDWSRYVDESTRELRQALDAIRPEFEKRLKARSLAPTTVQGMREWLRRRLGGNVPKGFNRMKKADLQRWVRTLETGAEVSPVTIMQEVARDMGIDLRGIIEAVPHIPDPASPDDILEFLLAREREAVLRGKAIPRVYFDEAHGNVPTPPEQDFVQAVAAGRKNAQTPTMETLTQSPDPELREMSRRIVEDESVVRQAVQDPPKKSSRTTRVIESEPGKDTRGRFPEPTRTEQLLGEEFPLNPTNSPEYGSARWFGETTFSSVDRVLRLLGKPGQRIIGAIRTRDIRKSEIYSDLRKKFLRDFLRSPEEVQEQVFRVLEGKTDGPISETVANMARKAREAMDEVANRLQDMGTQMRVVENTPDGPRVVIKPFQPLENYAPRLYDWKKILDKSHPLGFNQEVLEALVQSRQARDMAQAAQILREVRRGTLTNNPKAFFEYGRTVELPDKFLLPASVRAERWAQDVSAQLSLYEVFGGRLERLEDMKSVLAQSGIDPEVANYVNKALDHYLGTITPTRMSRLLSEVRSWNNIHKMMLSSIPNLAQGFLASTTRYGLINTLRGMKDVLFAKGATREALEEFAIRAGASLDPEAITQLMGEMVDEGFFSRIASKALRLYGFTASERFNQMLAIRVARISADDLFRALQSGKVPSLYQRAIGNNPARIRRMFQMAGVDIDAALQRGYLTTDDYVRIAHEFNRTTQFTHSVLDTPLWTDTPLGKTVFQYKRFVYRMAPMIRKEIYEEAKRFFVTKGRDGSIRPFLTFATLFPAVGWTIRQIREFISGYERDPDESVLTNIAESMAWVGGLGILEELNTLLQGDFYSVAKTLGGPSMGIIENLLGMAGGLYKAGVAGTIGKDPDEAQRQLAGAARHAARGILPAQIGAPLARGDVPLVGRVIGQDARDRAFIGLAQVFRPEEASSEHLAQKHYNKVMKQIERGYAIALENAVLRGEADFSQFIKALEDAERLGVFITLDDFMRRLDSPTTQLEILKRLRKKTRSAHQREVIDLLIQKAKIMQSEQRRENIPRPALGVLERIER